MRGYLVVLLVLIGCHSSAREEVHDAAAADSPGSPDSSDAGPRILTFGTDVQSIAPGEAVRFVALVTHPNGLDKLVGGRLTDPTHMVNYGAFAADNQGSYSLDVSWDQLNRVTPVMFEVSESRMFIGEFFDRDGRTASQPGAVTMTCNGKTGCSGACVDLMTDVNNCGRCGNKLPPVESCQSGKPVIEWSPCTIRSLATGFTCTEYCTLQGFQCASQCGSDHMQNEKTFDSAEACPANGTGDEFMRSCDLNLAFGVVHRCCCVP
jgi:hypothetical protein